MTKFTYLKDYSLPQLRLELINACENGELENLQYICFSTELKQNISVELAYQYGLRRACGNGHLNIIQYLIENKNYNITKEIYNECLLESCIKGQLEVIKYFFTSKSTLLDIHYQKDVIIKKLCEYLHTNIIKYLCEEWLVQKKIPILRSDILQTIFKTKSYEIIDMLVFNQVEIEEKQIKNYIENDDDLKNMFLYRRLKNEKLNQKNIQIKCIKI